MSAVVRIGKLADRTACIQRTAIADWNEYVLTVFTVSNLSLLLSLQI